MQMRNIIKTNKAPAAIGTYSQAVESNGILFTSGQVGIDPETSEMVEGGVANQAIRVLKNIYAILSESGLDKTWRVMVCSKDIFMVCSNYPDIFSRGMGIIFLLVSPPPPSKFPHSPRILHISQFAHS